MRATRFLSMSLLAIYAVSGSRASTENMFNAPVLSDEELAEARGGFSLPNGMTVDFGAVVTTLVDGVRVLQTELRLNADGIHTQVVQGTSLAVPIPGAQGGGTSANAGNVTVNGGQSGTVGVSAGGQQASGSGQGVQANMGGVSVSAGIKGGAQIDLSQASASNTPGASGGTAGSSSGQSTGGTALPATGAAIGTSALADNMGIKATAILPQLLIEHEVGQRISSLIINTGNNRVIDNQVTFNLTLGNVQPLSIGSLGFQIQSLGVEAATWRGMGG